MRRTRRNKKFIALLATFALLATLLMPVASFAGTNADISGGWVNTTVNDGVYLGTVVVTEVYSASPAKQWDAANSVYVTLTLPEGVEFNSTVTAANYGNYIAAASTTTTGYQFIGATSRELTIMVTPDNAVNGEKMTFAFNNAAAKVNIKSTAPADIKANVRVLAVQGGVNVWDESSDVLIGRTGTNKATVTGPTTIPVVEEGSGNAVLGKITISETAAGALTAAETITITSDQSAVSFAAYSASFTAGLNTAAGAVTSSSLITLPISAVSTNIPGRIEITPTVNVGPNATGDITVTIACSDSAKLATTTLTIAKVGKGSAKATVKSNDQSIYQGTTAKALTTDIDVEPLSGASLTNGKSITLELPTGFEWATMGAANVGVGTATYGGSYNDKKTLWYTVNGAGQSKIQISNLNITAKNNAPAGEVKVKVGGSVSIDQEVVIATAKVPFIIETEKKDFIASQSNQAGANIVIKEAAAGAMAAANAYRIYLPLGAMWNGTPTVKVTSGNMTLNTIGITAGSSNQQLDFTVGSASTGNAAVITISGIKYDFDNRVAHGNINAKFADQAATVTPFTEFSVGSVYPASKKDATFVIGSDSFTVNGETVTMDVAPYIKDGRTYLPVRYVAQSLGVSEANILWDAASQKVTLIKGSTFVQLTIGSKNLLVNGVSITMDVAPEISNGRTMLPIRFIAQALGASVGWDEATQQVTLNVN